MTASKYELLRHALGVHAYVFHPSKGGRRYRKPYRNHFCAGDKDAAAWEGLVSDGLASRVNMDRVPGAGATYVVTEAGRAAALAGITFKRRWGYGRPENA